MPSEYCGGDSYPGCAVIVARAGSKRLVHKNIRFVGGKPVIVRAIEACRQAPDHVGVVIVSTDSAEFAEMAADAGAHVIMRPDELAGDTSRIDEAAAHAVRKVFADTTKPPWTLMVQPNIPLWEPRTIERIVERALKGDCTAVVTAHRMHERPEWAMRLQDGYLQRVQAETTPVNSQELSWNLYHLDGQVVCVKTKALLGNFERTYLGPAGHRIALHQHERVWGTDIDDIYDLMAARAIHDHLRQEGKL